MKKLTFDELENTLNREEMRNIMAGSGGTCPPGENCYTCKCYSSNTCCSGYVGSVTCIGGDGLTCCEASYSNAASASCSF